MRNQAKTFADIMASQGAGTIPRGLSRDGSARQSSRQPRKPKIVRDPENNADFTRPDNINLDEWRSSGVREKQFRQLRKGQPRPSKKLDLHGETCAAAQEKLNDLIELRAAPDTVLLVVCGRGHHSQNGKPRLKPAICGLMREHPSVIAYHIAQRSDGGDGAYYVLLK